MGILNADGAFAQYVSVPIANLHAVPESIPDEEAVFTEPLAAAFEILTQIQLDRFALWTVSGRVGGAFRKASIGDAAD